MQVVPNPQPVTPGAPGGESTGLSEALEAYRSALEELPLEPSDTAPARVMRVLRARSRLEEVMSSAGAALDDETLTRIIALDERLRSSATRLDALIGRSVLAGWRETVHPPEEAWWWSLDARAAASEHQRGFGWLLLAGLVLTSALSLSAEIAQRFLSGEPDFVGVFSSLSQLLLALLSAGALTQRGGEWLDRHLAHPALRPGRGPLWKLGLAVAVLGVVLALKLSLPAIAGLYNQRGVELHEQGEYHRAIQRFQRAIALDPSSAQAHYNLAVAYEFILDNEAAIAEYELARQQGHFPQLYNNLARLYILHKKEPELALRLLNQAAELGMKDPEDPSYPYALQKNRGWALLGLGLYRQAGAELDEALKLKEYPSAAHCLLAQVREAQESEARKAEATKKAEEAKKAAFDHWQQCVANHTPDEPVEAVWLETAGDRDFKEQGK